MCVQHKSMERKTRLATGIYAEQALCAAQNPAEILLHESMRGCRWEPPSNRYIYSAEEVLFAPQKDFYHRETVNHCRTLSDA